MGISTSPAGRARARANINITPLVDVVLVLLIVFLVAAPVLMKQHEVSLPDRDATGIGLPPITVAVHGDGNVSIDADGRETTVLLIDLAPTVRPLLDAHPGRMIVLDVQPELPYQIAVETIDTLRSAGGGRVTLARE
ncbi:MAG TPA: biopolymer transporter ExbD [Kofleriaceae bacterium]|nr:biopolymer transporter ExbD [Kofleriaceae bacterium]